MSLLKYHDDAGLQDNSRGRLSFTRAHIDGMPFRGDPGFLRENEFQDYCETVYDVDLDVFDVMDPEQKRRLQDILDRAANQLYRVMYISPEPKWVERPDGKLSALIYCCWAISVKELNRRRLPTTINPELGV